VSKRSLATVTPLSQPEGLDKKQLLAMLSAMKKGDFSVRLPSHLKGIDGQIAETLNALSDTHQKVTDEVERISRLVGKEGKIDERISLTNLNGARLEWVKSINNLIGDLVWPTSETSRVIGAVATGDLSQRVSLKIDGRPLKGEFLRTARTVNTMVDQLSSFASEVTRVAREVGTEGKLGGQAMLKSVSGTWKDLIDNVNLMASNLTNQVRNIALVTTAVAKGDLSKKITVPVKGEIMELKNTINTMVDQLGSFASEVTRVAREVGTEGKLGGQADVKGVSGTWKDLTENVNFMASNLTSQVRNIAEVTTAVANGDLTKKITVDVKGEILKMKNTINTMVDQLSSFASEVTRVAREVGTEGKLGGQADVKGVSGTWKGLTDNVNSMANNLTNQVRNIAKVTTAVATGDLGKKITVDAKGEILELKDTINTMVDQLSSFASEVTRVAREVGTEGKLGGQAEVKGVSGTWKDLTDNVNFMANNLTSQVRGIAKVVTAVATGDLGKKITVDVKGEILELKDTINTMVDQLSSFASEVTRVAREVGTEGKLGGQADVRGVSGTWKDLTDNVNLMAANLTSQVRNIAKVTTAVATGDLSKKITVDVKGEILELKDTINTMVDQLSSFASEVTRVAREVGTEGKLGGQGVVRGVSGTWKDLTDNVNFMANNLTSQVRGIAKVVTAVANGNLKQKLVVEAKGEIAALADTINSMIETLATFADQVTSVAREVGVEGQLGGQASVPGAAGTWKSLTDNVNQLAANLTTQVRAIAEVATAVTKGDLTRSISVEAQGEVAALKDNINEMIGNLKDTTEKTTEQDWLKTNLAKFSRMLQGQRDLMAVGKLILSELSSVVNAQHSVFYMVDNSGEEAVLKLLASYAYKRRRDVPTEFKLGEGIVGECALQKKRILLTTVPHDYIQLSSGLGEAKPLNIMVLPVLFEGQIKAVLELASFDRFIPTHHVFLEQLTESIGIVLNTIEANMRTEELLKQSQSLAHELQSQQGELKRTNEELEHKAHLLVQQKAEVEEKNREVELARQALEEKAEQLALTSKYKSEFLANMSHELRTPLNSLLILAQQLTHNPEGNLTDKQKEFARTIHSSGSDLLALINDILDLSKIESGTVILDVSRVFLKDLGDYVDRNFHHVAEAKGINFNASLAPNLPPSITTDFKRLQQILKNLLSNAFKFTEKGKVELQIETVSKGWSPQHESLNRAGTVVAISVSDTGIGIHEDKQKLIFEAFQQADGTTSRKYGGTGLGLSISRELTRLLGGEIRLTSTLGKGSVFTLYLPQEFRAPLISSKPRSVDLKGDSSTALEAKISTALPQPTVSTSDEEMVRFEDVLKDDREGIKSEDSTLLVIEDDVSFAQTLLDRAHAAGFKVLAASRSEMAWDLVHHYSPRAILVDINLADVESWKFVDRLKNNLKTRHIPVAIISLEEERDRGRKQGGLQYLTKPVRETDLDAALDHIKRYLEKPIKTLLVVEDNETQRSAIEQWIGFDEVEVKSVSTGSEALELLSTGQIDCMILDLGLPDMNGLELLERIKKESNFHNLSIIVYTGRALTLKEEAKIQRLSQTLIIKDVQSPERLFDKTALYLHREFAKLPVEKQLLLERMHQTDLALSNKKVLVVDDDIRNIFAVTSLLERHEMKIVSAENGREAIKLLQSTPNIDIVLMDIMMPEMDGYETIRAIRKVRKFKLLPIIALTAKAMKGDRQKCIEAGASDFIAKPVDTEQLLSFLRVWLYR
jgi:HAMP domain-containing protein/signal transduction histidine kinase/DNA-binding response OmpR family regulator